jgi:hypothetical protein
MTNCFKASTVLATTVIDVLVWILLRPVFTNDDSINEPPEPRKVRPFYQPTAKDGPLATHPFRSSALNATPATQHCERRAKVDQIALTKSETCGKPDRKPRHS